MSSREHDCRTCHRCAEGLCRECPDHAPLPRWEMIALDWKAHIEDEGQPTVIMPVECPLCPPGMARIDCPGHDEVMA